MTTIPACDVLPDMVIRTVFDPGHLSGATAVATLRVTYVDEFDGAVCIHADSPSSRIFEIPDYVQVQVLKWPSYAHEAIDIDPEVTQSWHEDSGLEADNEAARKALAEDDDTRIPMVEVNGYIRDVANGGIPIDDQVKAAVGRVLRRQESKASNPSNTRVIDAAGKTAEQVVAEAKAAMRDGEWTLKSVTPSKPKHPANGGK